MSEYTEKNRLRREHTAAARKSDGPGAVKEARRMRRVRQGKFGTSPNHLYNIMILGTSAVGREREDKGDERIPVVTVYGAS